MTRIPVAAGLLLNERDEALMTQRPEGSRRPLMWEYPGGKFETGRDADMVQTLAREWEEELGVIVDKGSVSQVAIVDLFVEEYFEVSLYRLKLDPNSPPPSPREGQNMVWADVEWSVQHRVMVPSCYTFHRHVVDIIRRRRANSGRRQG